MGSQVRFPGAAPATLTIVVALSLTGCDGSPAADQDSPDEAASNPAELAVDVEDGPLDGTCWDVPADDPVDPDYWFDDSPRVPCSEPHTTETVHVLRLHEPTAAAAEEEADICYTYVSRYIGIDTETWVPWRFAMFLPSKQQIADGASWARCDVLFPSRWDFSRVRTTTGSAVSIADDPPLQVWACLDQPPTKREQPFVPCDQPHAYEETGRLAYLGDLRTYPAAARLAAEAREQCGAGLPDRYDGSLKLTAVWDKPEEFQKSGIIVGACFISAEDGDPLPPRN